MRIGGSYVLSAERDRAWQLLRDPGVLSRCLPGCQSLDCIGPDEYQMRMKMVLASIQGLFQGKVRIADENPPERFRLLVDGTGKVGFMKGDGTLVLAPQDGSGATAIHYEGEVQVGGMIAAVGQRLIENTARLLIRKFFEGLVREAGPQPAPPQ